MKKFKLNLAALLLMSSLSAFAIGEREKTTIVEGTKSVNEIKESQKSMVGERKDAYYVSLSIGPSIAVGDYGKRISDLLSNTIGLNLSLAFSAKVWEKLAVRVDYGAFAQSGDAKGFPGVTASIGTGFFTVGPEIRLDVAEKSQVSFFAGIGSASSNVRVKSDIAEVNISSSGFGWGVGANFRTPVTSRIGFIATLQYQNARLDNGGATFEAINPSVGMTVNFGK